MLLPGETSARIFTNSTLMRETQCGRIAHATPFTERGKPACAVRRRDRGHPWDVVRDSKWGQEVLVLEVDIGAASQYVQFLRINVGTLLFIYIYIYQEKVTIQKETWVYLLLATEQVILINGLNTFFFF